MEERIEALNSKERRFALCPNCKMQCEKVDGCSLVCCNSEYCQGETSFCISCLNVFPTKEMYHECGEQDLEAYIGSLYDFDNMVLAEDFDL